MCAGSFSATFELKPYMIKVVTQFAARWPHLALSLHVADLSLDHRNNSLASLLRELRDAAAWLIYSFKTELGLPFSPSKAVTLASSTTILNAVKQALGKHAGSAKMTTRRLGVDYSLSTKPRVTKVLAARLLKASFRPARQNKWAGNTKHAKLFHCATIPSALFGIECVPVPPTQIRQLRADGLKTHSLHSPGIAHDTAWLSVGPAKDPAFIVAWAPIARWHREIWLNTATTTNMHGDVLFSEHMCRIWHDNKGTCTKHHGRMAKKTIIALITGLKTLQWTLTKWDSITLHNTQQVEVSICPPAMLKQFAIHAYTQALTIKYETKLKNHHPDHYDTAHDQRRTRIKAEGTHLQEQTPIRAIQITFRKMAGSTLKVRTLLRLISGSVLTRTQARKQGHPLEVTCPMCGELDTISHRIHTCFCSSPTEDTTTYPTSISYQRALHMLPPCPQGPRRVHPCVLPTWRTGQPLHLPTS
jgi:hypothetical protein